MSDVAIAWLIAYTNIDARAKERFVSVTPDSILEEVFGV